jgi:hypothetical protein
MHGWMENICMGPKDIGREGVDYIHEVQEVDKW